MDFLELQEEEREVLISIYESDECFKQINDTTYTYKVGDDSRPTSFLLQITWGESYPTDLPDISLDAFYNKHLNRQSKVAILSVLKKEAEGLIDSAMTYSLFEFAKENGNDLVTIKVQAAAGSDSSTVSARPVKAKKEKKEQLSKAVKRKMADRMNHDGELPRGWNWVDIIKLSKTGGQSN